MINQVYVGLGGNLGDSISLLSEALEQIRNLPTTSDFRSSQFYRTSPVDIEENNPNDFINAACTFKTILGMKELQKALQNIEYSLGKSPKKKNESRPIDLDILFFGEHSYVDEELIIPHPRWIERLFVLTPLAELTPEIYIENFIGEGIRYNLKSLLKTFKNPHNERITLISRRTP